MVAQSNSSKKFKKLKAILISRITFSIMGIFYFSTKFLGLGLLNHK